jgi:hypothetical protein
VRCNCCCCLIAREDRGTPFGPTGPVGFKFNEASQQSKMWSEGYCTEGRPSHWVNMSSSLGGVLTASIFNLDGVYLVKRERERERERGNINTRHTQEVPSMRLIPDVVKSSTEISRVVSELRLHPKGPSHSRLQPNVMHQALRIRGQVLTTTNTKTNTTTNTTTIDERECVCVCVRKQKK